MASLLNFIKAYHFVQKLIVGTDTQESDPISLFFSSLGWKVG
jgi:hypothetical protein